MGNLSIDNQLFQTSHHLLEFETNILSLSRSLSFEAVAVCLFLVSLHVTQNRYILYGSDLFALYTEYPNPALVKFSVLQSDFSHVQLDDVHQLPAILCPCYIQVRVEMIGDI